MNFHDVPRIPARLRAILPASALILAAASIGVADKVYFKNGKVLDGVIEEEFESRIEFLHQGQKMKIPRERIDRIEKDGAGANVDMLIAKVREALDRNDPDAAEDPLAEAIKLDGPTGPNLTKLKDLRDELAKIHSKGNSAERRKSAEQFVKQAAENFDKIQTQKGIEYLLKALDADPSYEPAHEEMAKFLKGHVPDLNIAADYFCDAVDPEKIKPDHPVIDLLPQIYVDEVQKFQSAKTHEEMKKHSERLKKIDLAFASHPAWKAKATEAQKALMDLGIGGVVSNQVQKSLDEGNYQEALGRLKPMGSEKDSPELTNLYTRVYIGLKDFDKAKELLAYTRSSAADPGAIDKTVNAIDLYKKAMEAAAAENNKDARGLLNLLFEQRKEINPEISRLVADAKVGYDISEMEYLDGNNDPTGAANLAVQISEYSSDKQNLKRAEEAFAGYALQLNYKFKLVWILDGVEIPTPPEWNATVQNLIASRYEIKFNDQSPFELVFRVIHGTKEGDVGKRVFSTLKQPDPYTVDYIEPDTVITSFKLDVVASHPSNPNLYTLSTEFHELPKAVVAMRDAAQDDAHKKGKINYMYLTQMDSFKNFLDNHLVSYLPADLALIGTHLKLDTKK